MSQVTAQSSQIDADQHHANWQQACEGVVIALHTDSATQYGSAGLTHKEGFKPDKTTVFEIGSITKVFTAILLAEAVRENKAEFNDSVSAHLTALDFKKGSPFHKITLTELAAHTSGLPRLPVDLDHGAQTENPYAHYNEQRLKDSLVAFRKQQLQHPGERSYSNYGAGILGFVLTQIYSQSYRDLLKEKILDPLCMNSTDVPTRFSDLPTDLIARIATPHSAGRVVCHWELGALVGAGAMISSAEDLIRFAKAHWDDQTPQGLAESLKEVAGPRMAHQGLGWRVASDRLTHGGGTGGFSTHLEVDPKNRAARVFLSNTSNTSGEISIQGDFSSIRGYWSGVLNAESVNLQLIVCIDETGQTVVYSIDQGIQPLWSTRSSFVNEHFAFSFPDIKAIYSGQLDNGDLVGIFTQDGGRGRPLTMHHSKNIPDKLRKGLGDSMQGDLASLKGYWSGYIGGEREGLFVYIRNTKIGELSILELFSPDQHDQANSISSACLKNDIFEFGSNQVNGTFRGQLAKDCKCISGKWEQGQSTPLTLHFSEDKPVRGR